MLEQLRIKGFQAHTKLRLDLAHPVVSIVGPTDTGKSAALRSLKWLALNRPGGDSFINWEADAANVFLVADGVTVARLRTTKGGNEYGLRSDGDKQLFKAFGTGVPDPVAELLNVDEGNFQGQHDASYWFSDTPGNVAKKLNAIINLDIIDDVLGRLNGKVKAYRKRADDTEDRITRHTAALDDLKPAITAVAAFDKVLDLWDVSDSLRLLAVDLQEQVDTVAKHADRMARADAFATAGSKVGRLGDTAASLATTVDSMAQTIADIVKAEDDLLDDWFFTDAANVTALYDDYQKADAVVAGMQELLAERALWSKRASDAVGVLDELKKELGEVCPACGQPVAK